MSVYFGEQGIIELRRASDSSGKRSVVDAADVNSLRRRFSFDFDNGFLVTGDKLDIRSTDGALLDFVDPSGWLDATVQNSGSWYISVDELGGIRLYHNYDDALAGEVDTAIPLAHPSASIPVTAVVSNAVHRIVAQCTYYELNTNREVVDATALGDEFRSQLSGLISGSGSLRAFWEYTTSCGSECTSVEYVHYLHQLAIRTEIGSRFSAKLYIKSRPETPSPVAADDTIWYEIDGVITQAGVSFAPGALVESTIEFVTTGPIRLLTQTNPANRLLQEDTDRIQLEQDPSSSLLRDAG